MIPIDLRPVAYILVGLPASGKSTWVANQEWAEECAYISTDHYIEEEAKEKDTTYNTVFDSYMPIAVKRMECAVMHATDNYQDVIWDQTSLTVKSRKRKFQMLRGYKMIAVIFKEPTAPILEFRLNNRPGKTIPDHCITKMRNSYVAPNESEGFEEIWNTN